ncbi:MAG: 30S ribosomal protein S16 [Sandaracinaceae bacterium]
MVKIRLARHGSKKRPYYHMVVADSESPRNGRFLEQVGRYDPSRPDEEIHIDLERVDYWLGVGAQPTDRARKIINVYRRIAPTLAAAANAAAEASEAAAEASKPAAEASGPVAEAASEAATEASEPATSAEGEAPEGEGDEPKGAAEPTAEAAG